jgi:hypothetical protein
MHIKKWRFDHLNRSLARPALLNLSIPIQNHPYILIKRIIQFLSRERQNEIEKEHA